MRIVLALLFWGLLIALLWHLVLRPILAKMPRARSRMQDELVKDPVCQTYLPRSRALARTIDGVTRYFCSQECLRRYLGPFSLRG